MLSTPPQPAAGGTQELLSVTTQPHARPGLAVVEVVGEVDGYTAPVLEACLSSQADRRGVRELVVDLRRVTFLGVAGVAVLARAQRRCRARGARLVIRSGGRGTVLRPLRLTGLADVVAVDPPASIGRGRARRARRRARVPVRGVR